MNLNKLNVSRIFLKTRDVVADQSIRLDSEQSLSSLVSRFGFKIVSLCLRDSKKIVNRIKLYHKFSVYLFNLNKRHGSTYVVKYLKACSLAISKCIAGQPFTSLKEIEPDLNLPRLSRSGLPVIIGTRDRKAILSGSHKVIRLYLSLFSLYRIISIPCKVKLDTITNPYSGDTSSLDLFCSSMRESHRVLRKFIPRGIGVQSHNYLWLETASPLMSKSWFGLVADAMLICRAPHLLKAFIDYSEATGSTLIKMIIGLNGCFKLEGNFQLFLSRVFPLAKDSASFAPESALGKLSLKEEPAGKMRVFAIVDGWTQALFLPLHKFLISILSSLPNDGTKDQDASYKRACAKAVKYNCCYGYDLSSATDRLPLKLQVAILASLLGEKAAHSWATILVGRNYRLYDRKNGETLLRYAVGQPMGALSSFAMLGLGHHMILQYCAWELGRSSKIWEDKYEIVGDDVVIFDKDLACKYLHIMGKLGVPINETKSVVSTDRPVVEFIKRVYYKTHDVSPITWKTFMNQDTFRGRINTFIGLVLKDNSFTERPLAVFSMILKRYLWDERPLKDSVALIALMNSYFERMSNWEYLLKFVRASEPLVTKGKMLFANFNFDLSRNIAASAIKGIRLPQMKVRNRNEDLLFSWAIKEVLRTKLLRMMEKFSDLWVERQVRRTVDLAIGLGYVYSWPSVETKLKNGSMPELLALGIDSEAKYYKYLCERGDYQAIKASFSYEAEKISEGHGFQCTCDIYELRRLVRQLYMTKTVNTLTLWNEDVINDPRIRIDELMRILNDKMNCSSAYAHIDRMRETTKNSQTIELDTCSVLQLITKGFAFQAKTEGSPLFDKSRFMIYARKSLNYKSLEQLKDLNTD